MVVRLSWRSSSGRETLREVLELSGGPPEGPGVVERPSRSSKSPTLKFGSGRESLLEVREWSRGPPVVLGVVGRLTQRSWSGREALLEVQK